MDRPPRIEFGKRGPLGPTAPSPPVKRSHHVALLLMGTLAVGGTAYALMPKENCIPSGPGTVAPSGAACSSRGSSSSGGYYGGSSSRSGFFGGSSNPSSSTSSASSEAARGGFGSFGRAFGSFGT